MHMHVEAKHLKKKFGQKVAVDDVSFELREGKILGLLGPNGAGKSTMIKMLSGQMTPTAGEVVIDGQSYARVPLEFRGKIGVMPQEVIVWENLTIEENLAYSGMLQRMTTGKIKSMTDYLVDALKLKSELRTQAKNLSGGYKRRLNLAISIIHEPSIVFLDEPTPGIDAQSRRFLMDFIDEFGHKQHHTVVLTDHYLDEAEKLSDYVIIIDNGNVIARGTVSEIKKQHGEGNAVYIDLSEEDMSRTQHVQELMKDLSVTYPQVSQKKQSITFSTSDPIEAMQASLHALSKAKLQALNISVKEPTLEDVFLLLTGRDVRE